MGMKCVLLLVISCALLTPPVAARPPQRQKRVSDQRLAELETLLALAKMKNRKYVTLPVGYGLIDVQQIGRRKRSLATDAVHQALLRDPSATDYDLSDIIADLSSNLSSSSPSDSLKDDPILESNYSEDEESTTQVEDSGRDKADFFLRGLRPGARALFFGMRGVAAPHYQRFI